MYHPDYDTFIENIAEFHTNIGKEYNDSAKICYEATFKEINSVYDAELIKKIKALHIFNVEVRDNDCIDQLHRSLFGYLINDKDVFHRYFRGEKFGQITSLSEEVISGITIPRFLETDGFYGGKFLFYDATASILSPIISFGQFLFYDIALTFLSCSYIAFISAGEFFVSHLTSVTQLIAFTLDRYISLSYFCYAALSSAFSLITEILNIREIFDDLSTTEGFLSSNDLTTLASGRFDGNPFSNLNNGIDHTNGYTFGY